MSRTYRAKPYWRNVIARIVVSGRVFIEPVEYLCRHRIYNGYDGGLKSQLFERADGRGWSETYDSAARKRWAKRQRTRWLRRVNKKCDWDAHQSYMHGN